MDPSTSSGLSEIARGWFERNIGVPTPVQVKAWPVIAERESALILAPTGSGKTLAAFLVALDRLMFFSPETSGTRVLYVSPLKALGVDVERNLEVPLRGLASEAARLGMPAQRVTVGVRSGDTSPAERRRLVRDPPTVLITTPESLYLMLMSSAREGLADVQTVIIDEIHAVCGTKRGAHLALSLERLELIRENRSRFVGSHEVGRLGGVQRIGLSATQRPLEEVARFLGGAELEAGDGVRPRPVTIIDVGSQKPLYLRVEPPPDLRPLRSPIQNRKLPATQGSVPSQGGSTATSPGPWESLYPKIVGLILRHRSTMIFVNSRRQAERLASALNEYVGSELVLAHHGSLARDARAVVETRLKSGDLRGIVATSSLELGLDLGLVDLVLQMEAPPSVASVLQRVGRAGHQVGECSSGVLFPKSVHELLACATAAGRAHAAQVETTCFPRNPLDVLAQHIVAVLVVEKHTADELFDFVRRAAPFAGLPRTSFDGVLDMLSGRYPSERFSDLRPRLNWDRGSGTLEARRGARLLATANGGTIVDRGMYGVYLSRTEPAVRVGELDEEMVFETRPGEVFLLGASSWRVDEITFDRVLVTPAPGEPGRMPFWRGTRPGRSEEFGRAMGRLARELLEMGETEATSRLAANHCLEPEAAQMLVEHLAEQRQHGAVPTDRQIVFETLRDDTGGYRVVLLSLFGGKVHAPWALAVVERMRRTYGLEVDHVWGDDGIVFRIPGGVERPEPDWFLLSPLEAEELLQASLSASALFGSYFRENAARALLLPRRRPAARMPLWLQRRRAADLLAVAREFSDFPMVLETYRECLCDVFDLAGLRAVLTAVEAGELAVAVSCPEAPSPFSRGLLYAYLERFMYEGDAPPQERRAQALALDHEQLRLLLGEPELRQLLEPSVITAVERRLLGFEPLYPSQGADDLHDLLARVGDLTLEELVAREPQAPWKQWLTELKETNRAIAIEWRGAECFISTSDAARYRDALGVTLPPGVPEAYLSGARSPQEDLILRYANTHGPFVPADVARRLPMSLETIEATLLELCNNQLLKRGAFLPGGTAQEFCAPKVLAQLRQGSLNHVRRRIQPVTKARYAGFLRDWQHLREPLRGLDGVMTVLEQLQGVELTYSVLVEQVLPARIVGFHPHQLSELCAAGELVWRAFAQQGGDTRVAFFFTEQYPLLAPHVESVPGEHSAKLRELLSERGALFFSDLADAMQTFEPDLFRTLWAMVVAGEVGNDTLQPLTSLWLEGAVKPKHQSRSLLSYRTRRTVRAGTEGRWRLLPKVSLEPTQRQRALADQLMKRFGILCREAVLGSAIPGGFAGVYPVLRAMEEAGRLRRGYFVEGLGAAQFALPGTEGRLRRSEEGTEQLQWLCAADPANPYGLCWHWPKHAIAKPSRSANAAVLLDSGRLLAYWVRGRGSLFLYSSEAVSEPEALALRIVDALFQRLRSSEEAMWLLEVVDHRSGASLWQEPVSGPAMNPSRDLSGWVVYELRKRGAGPVAGGLQLRREGDGPNAVTRKFS